MTSGFQAFPTFPQWLGKYSTQNKSRRLTNELVTHSQLSIGQGFQAMRLEYAPYLRERLLTTVLDETQPARVQATVDLLDSYGLSKDDFTDSLKDLSFATVPKKGETKAPLIPCRYELMDTKLKTALTRLYNSTDHRSQALAPQITGAKKKGKASAADDEAALLGDDDDVAAADDERDDEDADIQAFVKQAMAAKKKAKGTGKGASKGSKKRKAE